MKYTGTKTHSISFPLGGIGTGSIGLAGNGRLIDWEIAGKPNKGSLNGFSHFAVRAEQDGEVLDARVLQGDLPPHYIGSLGRPHYSGFGWGPERECMAGAPHFRDVAFTGAFPFAELQFENAPFPGQVRMTAFNPFIPLNDKDSGIPAAFFEISLTNTTAAPIDYTVVGALSNPLKPRRLHTFESLDGLCLLRLKSDGYEERELGAGDLTLATDAEDVSYQCYWFKGAWFDNLEVYWREMMTPGPFKERQSGKEVISKTGSTGMLAAHVTIAPGETRNVRFVIAWNHPWYHTHWLDSEERREEARLKGVPYFWKHYYATLWKDSAASAVYALTEWDRLVDETRLFQRALFDSDLPEAALEAVSANLAILKTATILRLEDGTLWGWEGVGCQSGCCEGSCSHVWNYAQAIPFLFPKLERSMRSANYRYNQDELGGMRFRTILPLGIGQSPMTCADGQFGDIMKTYRDWKVCGDTDWLRQLWPAIKRSIVYAWRRDAPYLWDPDKTGVLQGRQHHTLDMELFGPNAWLTGYYLGGLKAAAEMADALGEPDTAADYRDVFERGKAWVNEHLFNGEFYRQIIDLKDKSVAERFDVMNYWNEEHEELKYQIGEGCEIDQVIAQWHANLYGLGDIFDPAQVRVALQSLYRYNFRPKMREYFNACRLYALNDEGGLVICHWPKGKYRPMTPLPYSGETQNGYEWAALIQMIQSGLIEEGMTCLRALRDRYDGERRNPWNEFECGSNYARSMASYSLLQAFSGFQFDMTRGFIGFAPLEKRTRFRCFWSLDSGWGEVDIRESTATVTVLRGQLEVRELSLPLTPGRVRLGQADIRFRVDSGNVVLEHAVTVCPGMPLEMTGME